MRTDNNPRDPNNWEYPVVSCEMGLVVVLSIYLLFRWKPKVRLHIESTSANCLSASSCGNRNSSNLILFLLRIVFFVYCFLIQIRQVFHTEGRCFAFYTTWNYILQICYFALVAFASYQDIFYSMRFNRKISHSLTYRHMTILIFNICLPTVFLVSSVLWLILYPIAVRQGTQSFLLNWTSYSQHAINVGFFIIEFIFNQLYINPHFAANLTLWPTVYALFAWVVHGSTLKGFWPYPFMKVKQPSSPLWYAGMLVAHLLFFSGVYYLSSKKNGYIQGSEEYSSSSRKGETSSSDALLPNIS